MICVGKKYLTICLRSLQISDLDTIHKTNSKMMTSADAVKNVLQLATYVMHQVFSVYAREVTQDLRTQICSFS